MSGVWHFKPDMTESWAFWDEAFSASECEKIIELGETQTLQKGKAGGEVRDIRKSEIAFLHPSDETKWIFEKVSGIILSLNERFFRFDLLGLSEGLQFTKYSAPGQKYGRHIDNGMGLPVRKLSFTLQLSKPDDYQGGDLCLYLSEKAVPMQRKQGYVAVFPSWTLHEVKPVTKGTRYSLVAWVTGAPFR
jgi:PKHD-type hydroxylase